MARDRTIGPAHEPNASGLSRAEIEFRRVEEWMSLQWQRQRPLPEGGMPFTVGLAVIFAFGGTMVTVFGPATAPLVAKTSALMMSMAREARVRTC